MKQIILIYLMVLFSACSINESPALSDIFKDKDRLLPKLMEYSTISETEVRLVFSEEVKVIKAYCEDSPCTASYEGDRTVLLCTPGKISLTEESEVYVLVEDDAGNTSSFLLSVFGFNNRLAQVIINEFSAKGSSTQSERIELEVRKDGSLAGLYACDGSIGNENHGFSFPELEVKRGDFIVLYWIDEPKVKSYMNKSGTMTYNIAASSPDALGDNNGVFALYENKTGNSKVMDAIVYSDFEATTYSGFGSARVERSVIALKNDYEWFGEAFDYSKGTTTRTISRWNGSKDKNAASDYYLCITKGQTFGEMNNNQEYIAPEEEK